MTLTVGSLFSGIGGIDLGLERAGMRVIWQSEVDPYCCRVLSKHWPDVPNLGDVTAVDWSTVERPDLIAGGYPCQPFSVAGRRLGEQDPRHLWPHMLDAIRVLRPRYALLENVAGHLALGFGRVLGDLAESGYDTEWDCIPAAAVGAPHLRDRVFVVAYPHRSELRVEPVSIFGSGSKAIPRRYGEAQPLADASGSGGPCVTESDSRVPVSTSTRSAALTERAGGGTVDGAGWWDVEPDVGRVAYGVPSRVDRLRALGNAVVPQVAEWIGRQLLASCAAGDPSEAA